MSAHHYDVHVDPSVDNNPHSIALRLVGDGQRVLELGCGAGHVTEWLVRHGNEVVGVEVDPDAAALADRHATRVHTADLDVTPVSTLEEGPFDVVVMGDVIEHVKDPVGVLRDVVSVLPDGAGRLVISVPNVGHADIRLHLLSGRWDYQPDGLLDRTHLRWFTRAGLRRTLAEVGFVARRLDPVVAPIGASGLPLAPLDGSEDLRRVVTADPDAEIYQFVVEAVRDDGSVEDALADVPTAWPDLDGDRRAAAEALRVRDETIDALTTERDALRNEVDAWRRSRLVRYTQPLRDLRRRGSLG